MKSDKENILKKVDHRDGMTVPDGFFDDFCRRMEGQLPYNEAAESTRILEAPRTLWQRVRPFAYMAAMFAGKCVCFLAFSAGRSTVNGVHSPLP